MVTNEGFALGAPIMVWRWIVNLLVGFMQHVISESRIANMATMRIFGTIPDKRGLYTVGNSINIRS
jgi:hypothetical protein